MTKEKFISISLHQEMQRSYLEYAMSVIVGRALPDARDGMKPVQRRILFAMHELGLNPDRPFRKCARVVGDVLGKYHPHGDQAVYDALVRLVQNFSTKYPTLNGHGNFGSVDDDPPAAMRYTETRLAPIAHEALLQEIESNTVSYSDNFDGSQKEPDVLPAQLPFLFLNGSSGIAVGMATNIPPHNLGEIVDALIALIENNSITDNDLTEIVLGPDFPTGGELIYSNDIKDVYQKGRGSITIRGIINVEEIHIGKGKHKRKALIVTELPYQISKAGWIEKLAELVNNGKINGIGDIRDESDRDGMRIVIELKRDVNHDLVISELFKKTSLQANFGAIFLALIDGKPMQLSLKTYLQNFLEFRESTIQKRTAYFLNITKDKLEILEGFTLAVENIKKIIEIVQNSLDTNEAKSILSKILNLTNKQADAVLGMPIKKLTNLERIQIKKDIDSLKEKKNSLEKILNQRELLLKMLKEELINLKKKYNTKRKTKIRKDLSLDNQGKEINKQILDELINKETKLSIDNTLQIKKLSLNNYKKFNENNNKIVQKKYTDQFITNIQYELKIIALTSEGKLINIKWDKLLKNDYKLERKDLNNINPYEIINFHGFNNDREVNLCLICNDGRFKKVLLDSEMKKSNRAFSIINPKKKNIIINSFISEENEKIIIITSIGRLFKFNLSNKYICTSSKQAQGSILSKLFPQETIISCCKCKEEEEELIIATKTGDFFNIKKEEIFNSHNSRLGFIDEKIQIKKNEFLSIFPKSKFCSIITNKNRVAKLDFSKINLITNKKKYNVEFLSMEPNEYIEKIFILENLTA
tara:strand:+ start:3624 stop:6068 length:2445 start_codon:yes stop_codon:yes gene_type:complete